MKGQKLNKICFMDLKLIAGFKKITKDLINLKKKLNAELIFIFFITSLRNSQ